MLDKKKSYSKKESTVYDPLGLMGEVSSFLGSIPGTNPNHEGFLPSKYLATIHRNVENSELLKGKISVERHLNDITQDMKELVKKNLSRFIYCKDSLEEIFSSESEGSFQNTWLENVKQLFFSVEMDAKLLFEPMIDNRVQQEEMKKMLLILERLQFALSIPSQIQKNMELQEFGKVVQYYKKAKYLMHETKSNGFEKVYATILKQIEQVRQILFQILDDKVTPYEQKKIIIGYLLNLDCDKDPNWYYIDSYHSYIINELEKSFSRIQDFKDKEAYISIIKSLCDIMKTHLPIFWEHSKVCIYSLGMKEKLEIKRLKSKRGNSTSKSDLVEEIMKYKKESMILRRQSIDQLFFSAISIFSSFILTILESYIDDDKAH
jgi:hypothetical protein